VKPTLVKKTKILSKKETKKVTPSKKVAKKTKLSKVKEKKPVKK
jgi:DNA-directed RNA polymerase subunit H (RpoH/RPB5)